jgi:cytochrome c2
MKKLLAVAAVVALWAGTASAGAYHRGPSLVCADCHTMHASRSHKFGALAPGADLLIGNPSNLSPWLANGGVGNEYLLVAGDPNKTCLACHDNVAGIPDVMGANVNAGVLGFSQRPAGQLNDYLTQSTTANQAGHTMNIDLPTFPPPGFAAFPGTTQPLDAWTNTNNGQPADFECVECHAAHGAPSYRNLGNTRGRVSKNLRPTGNSQTWANVPTYSYTGQTDPGAGLMMIPTTFNQDVVMAPGPRRPGAMNNGDQYESRAVAYTIANADTVSMYVAAFNTTTGANVMYLNQFTSDQDGATTGQHKMNTFCATCHGNFHGASNTDLTPTTGKFKKHPTDTSPVTNISTLISPVQKTPVKMMYASPTTFTVACLSCHKGHGTTNQFGLIIPADKTANITYWTQLDADLEDGDAGAPVAGGTPTGTIRNLCITCHSMGRTGGFDGAPP